MPEISEEALQAAEEAQTKLTALEESTGKLKGEMDELHSLKEELESKLESADKELLSEEYLDFKSGKGKKDTLSDDKLDFDTMSNAEMVAHIGSKTQGDLKMAMKEMSKRMEATDERLSRAFAEIDVTLTASRHPDFDDNRDAIYKIAKANPSWSASKCYNQWKMESDSAKAEKAKADKAKADEDARALTEKGEGIPGSAARGKQLSKEEAAEAAYLKSFGSSERG